MKRNARLVFVPPVVLLATATCALVAASAQMAAHSAHAKAADPCAVVPPAVSAAVSREPGWTLLRLKDLEAGDRAIWHAHKPKACPGFAAARLGVGSGLAFAIALIRTTAHRREEEVILLIPKGRHIQRRFLYRPYPVGNAEVVWRYPPGPTRAWDGGPTIKVAHDSIIVEEIESRTVQFYFVRGRMRSVVTSD